MTSAAPGINTSPVEVTNISKHGFWLLLEDEELFLPFSDFPWFEDVPVRRLPYLKQAQEILRRVMLQQL